MLRVEAVEPCQDPSESLRPGEERSSKLQPHGSGFCESRLDVRVH